MSDNNLLPATIGKRNKYSPSAMRQICEALREGESLRSAAVSAGVDPASVRRWVDASDEVRKQYEAARDSGLRFLMETMMDLCEEAREAAKDKIGGGLRLAAIKLQLDSIKWILSKRFPAEYGERRAVELTGAAAPPPLPRVPEEAMKRLAEMQVQAYIELYKEAQEYGHPLPTPPWKEKEYP